MSYDPDFRWQYGPTETDPRPGAMWHVGCGGEVTYVEEIPGCVKCGQEGPPLIHLDGGEIYSWGPVSHSPWPVDVPKEVTP